MSSSLQIIFSLALLSLLIHPSFSQTTCKSLKLSSKHTFENCNDLPTLNAVLHWTYELSTSSLSVAFTASPPQSDGWVAWALNPTGTGMAGAQALVAHKEKSSVTVDTYDIQSYHDLVKGPISYNVSSLSAEESFGAITVYATWPIPKGETAVNGVWQVGPMANGNIAKHAFEAANLGSKMKLSLDGGATREAAGAPGVSPSGSASVPAGNSEASAPAPTIGAGERLASGALALGAILVSLFV